MASRAKEIVQTKVAEKLGLDLKDLQKTPQPIEPIEEDEDLAEIHLAEDSQQHTDLVKNMEQVIAKFKTKPRMSPDTASQDVNVEIVIILETYQALLMQSLNFSEMQRKWISKREEYMLQRHKQVDNLIMKSYTLQVGRKDKLIDKLMRMLQWVIILLMCFLMPYAILRGYIPFLEELGLP